MKKKIRKFLLSLIMSVTLVFVSVSPAFAGDTDEYNIYHGNLNFNDIEYEHYNLNDMNSFAKKLRNLITQKNKFDDIENCIYDMLYEIDYIQSLYSYTGIQISIDYKNSYYINEKDYCSKLFSDAYDVFGLAISDALKSDYKEQILEKFDFQNLENYTANKNNDDKLSQYMTDYYNIYDDISNINNLSDTDLKKLKNSMASIYSNIISVYKNSYKTYDDFLKYYWVRDFSSDDIDDMHNYVKKYIVPLYSRLYNEIEKDGKEIVNSKKMSTSKMLDSVGMYIGDISSDMKTAFQYMRNMNLYYIGNEKNNMNDGYTVEFYHINEPFIYLYKNDSFYDFSSLIHEFGHFYHSYNDDNYYFNITDDVEASEVHSQGLELLFLDYYDELFGKDANILRKYILFNMLDSIVQGCCIEEFERTVFNSEKAMSGDELTKLFGDLCKEYSVGFEDYEWISITHLYEAPGYYIGYAVSALIALDIWENSLTDKKTAVQQYLDFEYYSGYYYLQDIMEEVGIEDVFSENYIKGIETTIQNYLDNPNDVTVPADTTPATTPTNSFSLNMNSQAWIFIMIFVGAIVLVVVVGLVCMKVL